MARFERDGDRFEITSEAAGYREQQRARLAAGWARVCDPRCEDRLDGEPRDPVLEEALRTDPYDTAAILVYADWLQQRGHPRGALIAVQHALATRPDEAALLEEERRLLGGTRSLISTPLLAHLEQRRVRPGEGSVEITARNSFSGGQLGWDHGFVRCAKVHVWRRGADEDLLWELLRHPSARFLAELELRVPVERDLDLVTALLLHGPCAPLRDLEIVADLDRDDDPRTLALAGLGTAYPGIQELHLSADHVRLGELALPELRYLGLVTQGTGDDVEGALGGAPRPVLEELAVTLKDVRRLAATLEDARWPRLRVLRARCAVTSVAELGRALGRSSVAAQLEVLDLSETQLGSEAVRVLVEQRLRFPRLRTLQVRPDFVAPGDVTRLREAGFPVDASSTAADGRGDRRGDRLGDRVSVD
ncbi:MAG: TIGR02996 domain-containing protein [Myxococcota bacterium]|nr:TIGR02996 domain-containing protein [Myxococcota bacterium]